MALPDFDPDAWSLAEHGDSRQRRHASRLDRQWPHYQELWKRHVLPLTFRPHQPDNYFLRPTQKKPLVALADASYAAFFHYAGMVEWRDQIPHARNPEGIRASECLYCFFSHAGSIRDSVLHFCEATNQVLGEYSATPVFGLDRNEKGHLVGLAGRGAPECVSAWQRTRKELARYRNFLVHQRPVFLQGNHIPRPEYMEKHSGLTVITRLARNPTPLRTEFIPLLESLDDVLEEVGALLDRCWAVAGSALDGIDNPKYREDQLKLRPDDAPLTLERIHAARGG